MINSKYFLQRLIHTGYLLPAGLTGYLFFKGSNIHLPGFSCPFRALTGIPCPTCFLTRATARALRGDIGGSIQLHAFGPLVAAGLIYWSFIAIRDKRFIPKQMPAWPFCLIAIGLFIYWVGRLANGGYG